MENTIIVRSPILPLCINSLIKQDKIDVVNNLIKLHYSKSIAHPLEDFSTNLNNKNLKYFLKSSYRTTEFNGMVDEFLVNNTYKIESHQKKAVVKNYLSNKQYSTVRIGINPFTYKYEDNFYIIFTSKSGIQKIENNFFIQTIVKLLEKQKYNYKKLTSMLIKILSLSEKIVKENIDELLNSEFLLMYNRKLQKFGNINGNYFIKKSISELTNINLKDSTIKNLESIMRSLLSNVEYTGYSRAVNYFIEAYGANLISLEVLSKDSKFIKNILSIQSLIPSDCKFMTLIKEKQQQAILLNKQVIEINWKEIKKYIFSEITESDRGFDLFFHLYSKNSEDILDIDTGHNIYNSGKSHYLFESDSEVIEYDFFEDTIWYLSRKNREDDIKVVSENFHRYYIGVNKNNEFFVYDNVKEQPVNLIAKNNINLALYPIPFQLLLICSNKNNLTCNLRKLFLLENSFFTPEVRVNNVILNKKTWNFTKLKYIVSSFEKFSLFIEQLLSKKIIPVEVVLFDGDIQSLYNLKLVRDLRFIYSQIKKEKEVILKENLQGDSPIRINKRTHANQCIISFPYRDVPAIKYDTNMKLLNTGRERTEEEYYTVTFTADEYRLMEDLHKIKIKLIQKLDIKRYFWINYRNIYDNFELRLRVKRDYIPQILLEIENISYKGISVKIEKYSYEFYRYHNIGEVAFKKLSIYDSYFFDYVESTSNDNITKVILNTNTWLEAFYGDSLIKKMKILEKYYTIRRNNKLKKYFQPIKNEVYEKKLLNIKEILLEENISFLSVQEIQSLIHVSNNRIIGTNRKLEREIYKEILVDLKGIGYTHGIL
ncbi:lantibiotic dehydratase C-terminal domain-containing protein [Enterococcus lactis]|uniref:lantibiotic dehydratase C-terminal domain-containing protein n=2 Tax=Enterococcus TaxID=1350 RepID=UPI0003534D34|nr:MULTISPECIES: thiopeptide-type bacteriocin biosynthesis protein [Enterococcus]EPI14167.1 thiopeptide-type bacteriocin biosynthesis domain protein [Enterococcus faecium SD3B-2]MBE8862411.1 hypothetical protein [Enterococcus faecium]MBM1154093.1 hypothetical protein [Enterococcus durans]MDB7367514.1 hypothetical protein [Enterococcus faecium]MDB7521228.1 hypothetical protein [Enterococcus faecium]